MSANERPHRIADAIELAGEADFSLGKLRVQPSTREVIADGQGETLEPRVMQVLVALARRRGDVVSREQLLDLCWNGRAVSDDALNRSIARVRRLASDATFTLETIPRVGYRLTAGPDPIEAPAQRLAVQSQGDDGALVAQTPVPPRRRRRYRLAILFFALIAVTCAGFGAWQFVLMNRPFFAILPFDALGTDQDSVYLADSVPTAISSQLTAQGYKVVSPAVSFQYRGGRKSVAAKELAPRYIIDGSVRLEGDRLRITTRIDSVSQSVSVWSQDFNVAVQEGHELPERIATTLAGLFNPGVRGLFDNPPEVTAATMRIGSRWRAGDDMGAYVAARELMRKARGNLTVRIYYAIATGAALDLLAENERSAALATARGVAERVAKEAGGGAPMSVYSLTPPVEWFSREQLLRTGLQNEFADASGLRRMLAMLLANSGRLSEALAMSQQALSIDRLASSNVTTNAALLDIMGRSHEADEILARAERLWPGLEFVETLRFSAAIARRDSNAAAALLHDPVVGPIIDPPAERRPYTAIVRALETREPADLVRVESECAEPAKLARDRVRVCLQALALLDRLDAFFGLAATYFPEQRGATADQRDALWLANPRAAAQLRVLFRNDLHAVRADERFIPIIERMGLLDYWRESGKWPDFCRNEPASVCSRMRTMK